MIHTLRSTQIKSEHVAITNGDVTPVVIFGWNEVPNVSYTNGVFIVWWLFIISFENTERSCSMEKEYDFENAKKNPYTKVLKEKINISLSKEVLEYFKELSKETSVPYQTLINFYLLDCVKNQKKPAFDWK